VRAVNVRSYWLRIAAYFVVAQAAGYVIALELRGRYPQDGCFFVIYCALIALDEIASRVRRRRERAAS
jgi:hypothetical protein